MNANDPRDAYDLTGRVALVTGAGSGIGRSSATYLAAVGAAVVCVDRDGDAAKATAQTITAAGGTASAEQADVAVRADVEAVVSGAAARHGRLDVVANVAGIMRDATILDTSEALLDEVLGVNLKGVFFGSQAAARVMVEQGSGSIINMASGAVDVPAPTTGAYGIAKSGVVHLTRVLAMEVAARGVRVNAIAPGLVLTAMTSRHFTAEDGTVDEATRAAVIDGFTRLSPMRKVGEPEDIAASVLFLASDASSFMTGQILRPNGGATMPW